MRIALIIFDGFNEIDSLLAFHLLRRVQRPDWEVGLAGPEPELCSMNGLRLQISHDLDWIQAADAVLFGSGRSSREASRDPALLAHLRVDPARQLIGSQCSGALMLEALGLLAGLTICTDAQTAAHFEQAGYRVLHQPFVAHGSLAMAGGCLAGVYLATWVIRRLLGEGEAREVLARIAPVGEVEELTARALWLTQLRAGAGPLP